MSSQKMPGTFSHRGKIQGCPNMPGAVSHQGVPNGPVPDQITVCFSPGIFIGMEPRDIANLPHRNIRRKKTVQCDQQLVARDPAPRLKVRRLPQGMNSGVGSRGADQVDLFLGDPAQDLFDGFLNGPFMGLSLPASETGAVVFDEKAYIFKIQTETRPRMSSSRDRRRFRQTRPPRRSALRG